MWSPLLKRPLPESMFNHFVFFTKWKDVEGSGTYHDVLGEKVIAKRTIVKVDLVERLFGQLHHVTLVVAPILVLAYDLLSHGQLVHGCLIALSKGKKYFYACDCKRLHKSDIWGSLGYKITFVCFLPQSERDLCVDSRWRVPQTAIHLAASAPRRPAHRWGDRRWGSARESTARNSRTPSSSASYSSNISVWSERKFVLVYEIIFY